MSRKNDRKSAKNPAPPAFEELDEKSLREVIGGGGGVPGVSLSGGGVPGISLAGGGVPGLAGGGVPGSPLIKPRYFVL